MFVICRCSCTTCGLYTQRLPKPEVYAFATMRLSADWGCFGLVPSLPYGLKDVHDDRGPYQYCTVCTAGVRMLSQPHLVSISVYQHALQNSQRQPLVYHHGRREKSSRTAPAYQRTPTRISEPLGSFENSDTCTPSGYPIAFRVYTLTGRRCFHEN